MINIIILVEDEFKRYWKLSSPIVAEEMEEVEKTYRPYNHYRSLSVYRRTLLKNTRIRTSRTRTITNRFKGTKYYEESGLKELLKWILIAVGLMLASPLIIVSVAFTILLLPLILTILLPCILVYLLLRILSKNV